MENHPPDASPRTSASSLQAQTAAECVISSRKAWKTIKSQNEAVWPPVVEAALIAGLEKYRPKSVKDITLLKRFPKRNSWISDYIKRTTGRDRSPKQVGSRLQQLRDTCTDERIHKLLFRREYSPDGEESSSGSDHSHGPRLDLASTSSSPVSSPSDSSSSEHSTVSEIVNASFVSPVPKHRRNFLSHTSVCIELMPSNRDLHGEIISKEDYYCLPVIRTECRHISLLAPHPSAWLREPSVSFASPMLLSPSRHSSMFRVFVSGTLVHSAWTSLALSSTEKITSPDGSGSDTVYHYGTRFIPSFWNQIGRDFNPSQCRVRQYIAERRSVEGPPSKSSSGGDPPSRVVHVITYEFSVQHLAAPRPSAPIGAHSHPNSIIIPRAYHPYRGESLGSTRPALGLASRSTPGAPTTLPRAFDALGLNSPSYSPEPDGRAHYPISKSTSLSEEQERSPSDSFMYSKNENNAPDKSLPAEPLEANTTDSRTQLFPNFHPSHQTELPPGVPQPFPAETSLPVPQDSGDADYQLLYPPDDVSGDSTSLPIPTPSNAVAVNTGEHNLGVIGLPEVSSHHALTMQLGVSQTFAGPATGLNARGCYPNHISSEWDGHVRWPPETSYHSQSQASGVAAQDHPVQQIYDCAQNSNVGQEIHPLSSYVSSAGPRLQMGSSGCFDLSSSGYIQPMGQIQTAGTYHGPGHDPAPHDSYGSHDYVYPLQSLMSVSYHGQSQSQLFGMVTSSTGLDVSLSKGPFAPDVQPHFAFNGNGNGLEVQTYMQ